MTTLNDMTSSIDLGIPGFAARREAREDALALLYESEMAGHSTGEALSRRATPLSEYTEELTSGVELNVNRIDDTLRRHLVGWRVERMGVVDRALARIASWELMYRPDVPTGVVLSEAVALATQYCGSESPRFLNGVLRAIADDVRDTGTDNTLDDTGTDNTLDDTGTDNTLDDTGTDNTLDDTGTDNTLD